MWQWIIAGLEGQETHNLRLVFRSKISLLVFTEENLFEGDPMAENRSSTCIRSDPVSEYPST